MRASLKRLNSRGYSNFGFGPERFMVLWSCGRAASIARLINGTDKAVFLKGAERASAARRIEKAEHGDWKAHAASLACA